MNDKNPVIFARRPREPFERVIWASIPAVIIGYIVWLMVHLSYAALQSESRISWIVLPCIAVVIFLIYLFLIAGRTLRRAFAARHSPLVLIDAAGVTLNRTNPIMVPWSEITGASLEKGYRGATILLRLEIRNPTVFEAGKQGRVIDLRALAGKPADVLAAIISGRAASLD